MKFGTPNSDSVRWSHARGRKAQVLARFEPLEDRLMLSVSATPISSTGTVLHEQPGVKFTADLGNFVTLAPGTGLDATIDWGDGKTSAGKIKSDGVTGVDEVNLEVDGTHKYKKAGTYSITVEVVKPGPSPTTYEQLIASFNDTAIVGAGNTLLNGSITGTYAAAPTSVAIGAEYLFKGTGSAGDLGAVSAAGELTIPLISPVATATATGRATGALTLTSIGTTARNSGAVTLQLTGPAQNPGGGIPSSLTYVITGGTGAFAGATGFGSIGVTLGSGNSFTFDITSALPPITV